MVRCIAKNIRYNPHRDFRWIDISVAHHELFQDIVLNGSGEFFGRNALFFGGDNIKRHDWQNRAIHRHGYGHLVQRNAGKERAHIKYAINRNACHADITGDARMIAIIAPMRCQIERDR